MTARPSTRISSRKEPQQARSAELVEVILQAAVQVLSKEGAQRFTTARVAEKAGVSVFALSVFPQQSRDTVPTPKRRVAANLRITGRDPRGGNKTAA
jgi:tetracycline repressor-like protein